MKYSFLSVWLVFVSHWHYLLANSVLYGNWVLDACDDFIICTNSWFIQIFLEFTKRLVHKDFILKDTNLLVKLPWQSRQQSTIFISSNLNLVFLTCSVLCAKTDPLVFRRFSPLVGAQEIFLYFFLKNLFFSKLGVLSTPLCWWLKWTAFCILLKSCSLLTTILPLERYLERINRQSTCWKLKQNISNFSTTL